MRTAANLAPSDETTMSPAHRPLLLLAADDEDLLAFLEQGLNPSYRTLLAHDGQQAKDFYQQMGERIAAVITRVDLPIVGGVALTSWLLGQAAPPPVIVVGGGPSHVVAAARELWGNIPGLSWLDHPFPLSKLQLLVKKTLEKQ